jgi:hypothetical protein
MLVEGQELVPVSSRDGHGVTPASLVVGEQDFGSVRLTAQALVESGRAWLVDRSDQYTSSGGRDAVNAPGYRSLFSSRGIGIEQEAPRPEFGFPEGEMCRSQHDQRLPSCTLQGVHDPAQQSFSVEPRKTCLPCESSSRRPGRWQNIPPPGHGIRVAETSMGQAGSASLSEPPRDPCTSA